MTSKYGLETSRLTTTPAAGASITDTTSENNDSFNVTRRSRKSLVEILARPRTFLYV